MHIESIIFNPRQSLNYMERYINNGSISGFTWKNTTSQNTSPLHGVPNFKLLLCKSKENNVITYGEYPCFFSPNNRSILIHPDMSKDDRLSMFEIEESKISVMPTSSSRTVQLCEFPGYLKLNYWGTIGRVDRALTSNHIEASIEISQLLRETFLKHSGCFKQLSLLPESSAQVLVKDDLDFGAVYREEYPVGGGAEKVKYLIPFFSLFSKDRNSQDDKLLILQLCDVLGKDIKELIIQQIIFPVIEYYFLLIIKLGLQAEWHSQNLLLGLDKNLEIVSFVMRDIESIDVDSTLRRQLGLKHILNCFPYKHISLEQYNYQIKHSFMFDFKLGEYLIEPLIEIISTYGFVDKSYLYNIIKNHSKTFIKQLPQDFFPKDNCWYAVKPILINRTSSKRLYVNMGTPKFR